MDVDHHLPEVVRGKKARTLNGYMKCTLDRHSCCGGDFGRSKAEREDPDVGKQVLCILKEQVKAIRLAFPTAIWTSIARSGTPPVGDVFELPEIGLSFTPCHRSMMTFRANQVVHGTRIPDQIGQGCQRIGSAIAMQRRAMNVAIKHHKEMKVRIMRYIIEGSVKHITKALLQALQPDYVCMEGPANGRAASGTAA
ncbi:TPA: hypothetical protein ACH3X1_013364 [Trebouxia sp. C0004]